MIHPVRLIFTVFIMLLVGCSGQAPSLKPLAKSATIVAFGNSLTYGIGASLEESYPSVLQKLTGRKVINAGISGELSADGLTRLPGILDQHQPQLMILIHGGNDMLRKKNLDKAADNLRDMIRVAHSKNIDVIMMSVPNPTLILSPAKFYEQVADEMNVPIIVDTIADVLQFPDSKSDAVHPNAKGYKIMAESLYEALQSHGAL